MVDIRKADIPNVDMFNDSEVDKAFKKGTAQQGRGRAITGMWSYVSGIAALRIAARNDMTDTAIAKDQQVSLATFNKGKHVASYAAYEARDVEDEVDESKEEAVKNLKIYWGLHWAANPVEHPTLLDTFKGLNDDDGDVSGPAIATMQQVFGAPSGAYEIAQGGKVHADDPRRLTEDDGEQGDDEGNDQEDEKTPWQDRLAAIVAQAVLEGATASDILKVVNDSL